MVKKTQDRPKNEVCGILYDTENENLR